MAESKEDSSSSDEAVLKAVAERLRFFFSDANVRSDYFMRQKLLKSPDGFVPIEILLKFNSIKCHTTDAGVVVEAAKILSDQLTINKEETSIGRVVPFNMSQMNDNIPLSLYVKNLPLTEAKPDDDGKPRQKYAVTAAELRPLFEPYGSVALVKFRFKQPESADGDDKHKSPKKKRWSVPAGAAFIEFETTDELEAAAEELLTIKDGEIVEAKKSLEVGGNILQVVTMKEWVDSKKKKSDSTEDKKEETPQKEENNGESKKRDRDDEADPEMEEEEEFNIEWKPNTVISIKGLSDSCDREALRAVVAEFWSLEDKDLKDKIYCDFSRGQTSGAIRFTEPSDDISKIAEKINGGDILVAGEKVESAAVLSGEEEKKYWQDFIDFKRKQLRQRKEERGSARKRKFRRGKGGRD